MKSFLVSLVAIVAISFGAKFLLDAYDMSARKVFSSQDTSLRD